MPTWSERAEQFLGVLSGTIHAEPPDRAIRVVFLGHTAIESGGELALVRLLPGLRHTDAHVVLGADGPLVARSKRPAPTVEVLPFEDAGRTVSRDQVVPGGLSPAAVLATARYVVQLARRLRELQPDLVHTNTLKAALYGGAAARLAGVPVVWHIRDRIADDYLPASTARAVRRLAHVIPNGVITNSRATQRTLGRARRDADGDR